MITWYNSNSKLIHHPTEGVQRIFMVKILQAYIHPQTNCILHIGTSPIQLFISYDFCVLQPILLYSCSRPLFEWEPTPSSTSSWLVFYLLCGYCSNPECDKCDTLRNGWPTYSGRWVLCWHHIIYEISEHHEKLIERGKKSYKKSIKNDIRIWDSNTGS